MKRKAIQILAQDRYDAGTFESLNDASNFVRTIQERTGIKVGGLDSVAIDL